MLDTLADPSFFPSDSGLTEEDRTALNSLVKRWKSYVADGKFKLSVPMDLKMGDKGGELADCA